MRPIVIIFLKHLSIDSSFIICLYQNFNFQWLKHSKSKRRELVSRVSVAFVSMTCAVNLFVKASVEFLWAPFIHSWIVENGKRRSHCSTGHTMDETKTNQKERKKKTWFSEITWKKPNFYWLMWRALRELAHRKPSFEHPENTKKAAGDQQQYQIDMPNVSECVLIGQHK